MQSLKRYLLDNITNKYTKAITIFFFVVSFLCIPAKGFRPWGVEDFCLWHNILFPLSHANFFHLLCNMLCLWVMRPRYYIASGVVISFLCSLLPELTDIPVMGASGILFAIIGAKYGRVMGIKAMFRNHALFFVIASVMPNIACLFHLYCIFAGFAWGYIKETFELWRKCIRNRT